MMPLKDLLGNAFLRKPVRDGVRAAVVLEAVREACETLFRSDIGQKIIPLSFKNDTITLTVLHPALIQELRMRNREMLMILEERLGKGVVKYIKISYTRQSTDDMLS